MKPPHLGNRKGRRGARKGRESREGKGGKEERGRGRRGCISRGGRKAGNSGSYKYTKDVYTLVEKDASPTVTMIKENLSIALTTP